MDNYNERCAQNNSAAPTTGRFEETCIINSTILDEMEITFYNDLGAPTPIALDNIGSVNQFYKSVLPGLITEAQNGNAMETSYDLESIYTLKFLLGLETTTSPGPADTDSGESVWES